MKKVKTAFQDGEAKTLRFVLSCKASKFGT